MINFLETIKPYSIYVPVLSTGTGLYHLIKREESSASLADKKVNVIDPHEKAKIAISIIPFLGNFIVALINLAEKFFPAQIIQPELKIPAGQRLVSEEEFNKIKSHEDDTKEVVYNTVLKIPALSVVSEQAAASANPSNQSIGLPNGRRIISLDVIGMNDNKIMSIQVKGINAEVDFKF